MSTTSINFHNVVSATAKAQHAGNTHWLSLEFVDESGGRLSVALFNETPEALLESFTVKEAEAA
jgi:hypothetical protein